MASRVGKQNRCIVPATSFCEYADTKPRKTPKWFAINADRPMEDVTAQIFSVIDSHCPDGCE